MCFPDITLEPVLRWGGGGRGKNAYESYKWKMVMLSSTVLQVPNKCCPTLASQEDGEQSDRLGKSGPWCLTKSTQEESIVYENLWDHLCALCSHQIPVIKTAETVCMRHNPELHLPAPGSAACRLDLDRGI